MRLKKFLLLCVTTLIFSSIGFKSFANTKLSNPHLSDNFEISESESINNPTNEDIILKTKMDKESKSRKTIYGQVAGVGSSFLNVRKGPSTKYGVAVKLSDMTAIRIEGSTSGEWIQISGYRRNADSTAMTNLKGYVHRSYVNYIDDDYGTKVTTNNLNVREAGGTSFPILYTLPKGSKVRLGSRMHFDWAYVWRSYDKPCGKVSTAYLK